MPRLLIDVNSVVPYYATGSLNGIGRTTRELVQSIDKVPSEEIPFDVHLYSQNLKGIGAKNLATKFKTHHLWVPNRTRYNHWVKRLHLREIACHYDVMHIPHNYAPVCHPDKCVSTIHDAMFFTCPEEAFNPEFCRREYTRFANRCRAVLTPSHSSKRDIVEYMKVPEEKIFVAPWGCKTDLFHPSDQKTDHPFFLSTSCDLGRKNTISVIQAFAKYANKSKVHDLVLVWRNPPQQILDEIARLGIAERVTFAKNISDEELATLYRTATATFFPSIYEGFGLPVLESLACATPVVTCQNSSLAEVGGDAAIYVEPTDLDSMSDAMIHLEQMASDDLGSLRKKSFEQSKNFSWQSCARQTLQAYKYALGI